MKKSQIQNLRIFKFLLFDIMSMKTCSNKDNNLETCNCSYSGCPRQGICCECVKHHRKKKQLPACFFPDSVESDYDRSFEKFIEVHT